MKHEDWKEYWKKERIEREIKEVGKPKKPRIRYHGGLPDPDRYFAFRTDRPAPVDPMNIEGLGR